MKLRDKPFVPKVITANDLMNGYVIFLSDSAGWVRDFSQATIAKNVEEEIRLLKKARVDSCKIEGVYSFGITEDKANRIAPVEYREKIRILGPTHAEYTIPW